MILFFSNLLLICNRNNVVIKLKWIEFFSIGYWKFVFFEKDYIESIFLFIIFFFGLVGGTFD